MLLEVCAYNVQSAILAQQNGAGRIEFCADPYHGGITPSYGAIMQAIEQVTIPVYCMIRPRAGNFIYNEQEIAIIKKDIMACRELGCKGIATGAHLADGKLDVDLMKRMVDWAYPMGVTCHKVFDLAPDAFQALEAVINAGCERILSSGLQPNAMEGADTLKALHEQAAGRIIIMAGGGVRSTNISELMNKTGLAEYHSSALKYSDEKYIADVAELKALVKSLQ